MPYIPTRKNVRPLSGLGGFFDTVGDVLKGALNVYGQQQQAVGAQNALAQQQPVVAAPASSGVSTTTLVIGGVAVAGLAIVLLKRKK